MIDDESKPEVAALRALQLEDAPPLSSQARIVRKLKASGLLEPERRPYWKLAVAAVVLSAAFAAGWLAARAEAVWPRENRYVLLLYGESDSRSNARVEEYREWAREEKNKGRDARGERLSTSEIAVGGSARSGLTLQGFFVITAGSEEEAVGVAKSHPHVRHGGVVVVRPIDPT
jgi:hypothetical protein